MLVSPDGAAERRGTGFGRCNFSRYRWRKVGTVAMWLRVPPQYPHCSLA